MPSETNSSRKKNTNVERVELVPEENEPVPIDSEPPVRRRRKKKKLKSVPQIETIGRERRDRASLEQYAQQTSTPNSDFSIDCLVGSFETEESRKERLEQLAENRAKRDPFIARKAKPRKKLRGKPKRRHARKERLTGPKVYCFSCRQKLEHYHVLKGTTYYSFLFGITFGISALAGPFRCSVCSKKRMSGTDLLNPKYILRNYLSNSSDGYG